MTISAQADRSRESSTHRPSVLVVTHLFPTAQDPTVGPWVAEQVDALTEYADVQVLCCARVGADSVAVRDSGARVTYLDTSNRLGSGRVGLIASSARYARRLHSFLRAMSSPPDILHSHFGFPDAVIVGREARRFGIPHVATLHGSDVARVLVRNDLIGGSLRRTLRTAGATVCVSESLAHSTRAVMGADFPVSVIPSGVNAGTFRVSMDRTRCGILYVGHLAEVKNVDVLIEALAFIEDRNIPATIVGEGPLRTQLENMAQRLRVADRVRFLGPLGRVQVAELMGEARLFVLPSSREGWPVVVAEALACGTPVVATRVGGIPEILAEPDGGLLVEPRDAKALAEAIVKAYDRQWDADAVARSSHAPTTTGSARCLAELYRSVLDDHREAPNLKAQYE